MSKARRHVHKYRHVSLSYGRVWACGFPDCSHYMPAHLDEMMPGKYSICWSCGERFIFDEDNMKNDFPVCNDCSGAESEKLAKLIEQKGV